MNIRSIINLLIHSSVHFDLNDVVYIGGAPKNIMDSLPRKVTSIKGFHGCMKDVRLNGKLKKLVYKNDIIEETNTKNKNRSEIGEENNLKSNDVRVDRTDRKNISSTTEHNSTSASKIHNLIASSSDILQGCHGEMPVLEITLKCSIVFFYLIQINCFCSNQ